MNEAVLTERQVENLFGLKVPWLRRVRREHRGPSFLKIGKMVRYRPGDIEVYLAAHAVATREGHVSSKTRD